MFKASTPLFTDENLVSVSISVRTIFGAAIVEKPDVALIVLYLGALLIGLTGLISLIVLCMLKRAGLMELVRTLVGRDDPRQLKKGEEKSPAERGEGGRVGGRS